MNQFYPINDDSKQETVWNFLVERRIRRMANKKSVSTKRAKAALQKIEALMKEKP